MGHRTSLTITILAAFLLTACVAGDGTYIQAEPANFWSGLWHGLISVVTLIWGIFDQSVEVYERVNNGGWYDFGFLLGSGALAGGSTSAAKS